MATKFFNKPKNLAEQLVKLKSKYNWLDFGITNNCLTWKQKVRPTDMSREYILTLKYDKNKPEVYLINQGIMKNKEDKIPHCYKRYYKEENNEFVKICLYYPKYKEWTKDMYISDTIVPWAIEWLYYYEYWRLTGKWLGGGIEHEKV